MKSKKIFVLLAALALSLAACGGKQGGSKEGGESQPSGGESSQVQPSSQGGEAGSSEQGGQSQGGEVAVTSVTLDQATLELEVGKSATLKATVLPANASNSKVTWEVEDATIASVSSLGKVTALKVGNTKVIAKSQSNPEIKAECPLTVKEEGGQYGSLNKPKTVAQILAIAAEECKENNDKTSDQVYVKGIVSKAPANNATFSQNIYLKDALTDANDLLVYTANHDALKAPYQNDEVILHGYLMNYNGKIEISNVTIDGNKVYPEIDTVTRGTSTISYTVSNGQVNAEAPRSAKNNSEAAFTVTPNANYVINTVTANGEALTAQTDGSYKFTVKGNTEVLIDIVPEGVEVLNAVMEYPANDADSTNMTGGNDAALLSLDPTLFSVVSDKPTGLYAGLNKVGNFRLYNGYKNADDKTLGTKIVVSSTRATIIKIVVTLASSTVAGLDKLEVKAGDDVVAGDNGVYDINKGTFSLKNVSNAEVSDQIHITKVAISYTMNQEVHATAIDVTPTSLSVEEGKTEQLTAALTPANATDVVVWSSNDAAVATVDQTGRVTGVAAGNAVVTAKVSETIKKDIPVTVTAAAAINYGTADNPLTITEAKAILDGNMSKQPLFVKGVVSKNSQFHATYDNSTIWLQSEDGTVEEDFELYSCGIDSSIANAASYKGENGLKGCEVVATGYGKLFGTTYELTNTTIDGNRVNPSIIALTPAPTVEVTGITISKSSASLEVGYTLQLTAALQPSAATGTIEWLSSDTGVATVDQTGLVTAVAAGNATITAKYSETIKAECALTVTAPEPEPELVSVAKYDFDTGATTLQNRSIDAARASELFHKVSGADIFEEVTTVTNVYEGGNGGSGDTAFEIMNILKIGKSKNAGSMTFTLNQEVRKIVVKGDAWTATASITINGKTINEAFKDNLISKTAITDGKLNNAGTLEFSFAAADEITIAVGNSNSNANFGVVFTEMEFFAEDSGSTPEPTVVPLPIIAKGNQDTKVEGAGAWIYIDTTGLTLTPEMATAMLAVAEINLTVSMSDETPDAVKDAAQHYITGADAAVVLDQANIRLDDYGTNSVRLYIGMDKGLANDWMMKHEFEISIPLDANTVLQGSAEFVGGALRKINGEAYVAPVVIAQPTGTFFATPELTAGGQISIMVQLGADNSIVLRVGGEAVAATIASFDSSTGEMIVNTTAYGRIKVTYNPESGLLEGLSLLDATTVLKYDGYVNMYGNEKLKYWDCDGTTEELQAQFVRRYGSPWNNDTGNADRVVKDETNFKFGSGAKVRAWGDGRIALAVKEFDSTFHGKNLSFWVYNPGSSDISLQAFGYKATNFGTYFQIFDGKKAVAGQWTYISVGFAEADMYNFQIVVPNGTTTQLTFDDICLF